MERFVLRNYNNFLILVGNHELEKGYWPNNIPHFL